MKLFSKWKAWRNFIYLERLKIQCETFSPRQYKKLAKMVPPTHTLSEWMAEWTARDVEKQARNDKIIQDALLKFKTMLEWYDIVHKDKPVNAVPPQPTRQSFWKRPAFKWITSTAAACLICLVIAIPLIFGGNGGLPNEGNGGNGNDGGNGGIVEKPYTAWDALVLTSDDGIFIDDLYAEILERSELLVFGQDNVMLLAAEAAIDVYDDETEELLSYSLLNIIVFDFSDDYIITFAIDYRIRFVEKYEFLYWESCFSPLKDSDYGFVVGSTLVKYGFLHNGNDEISNDINTVFMCFSYGEYDYFLKICEFEMTDEDTHETFVVTPLEEEYLVILMQILIPQE